MPTGLRAQASVPWSAPVRGSWVRSGPARPGDVVLVAQGAGSEIVVGAGENAAVHQAATFLAGDIERISGYRPPIVEKPSGDRVAIRLQTLGLGPNPPGVDAGKLRGQWEAYRIVANGKTVWLVGSNPRGTAFAAYTLSERLGIDPLYLWTRYVPERHDPLVLERTSFAQGPPTFRFRGFFHDDEDILPRPFDERGYPLQLGDVPLDWYKRYFETALRLRMNMVAPYVRVHRRYEVQKLASDWGLHFTSHHYDILVSNPWGLERFNLAAERGVKPDWNWFTNKEGMLKFWRGGVEENKDLDVIWPVGMRGTADRPYTFPEGTTDAQKAQVFREAIQDQVNMVKELLPRDRTPLFHFTMYTEMLDQYRKNPAAFDLPKDVIIVWPDDNDGHMRGLPTDLGGYKHGVYYHLAYLGGFISKQNVTTVSPATVAAEFDRIVKAGATEFMLVNVSELREYVMGAREIADITWNAPAVLGAPDPAARFIAWWSREYFGDGASAAEPATPAAKAAPATALPPSAQAADEVYGRFHTLLDRPDKLWYASNAILALLDRLYHRVAGEAVAPIGADTLAALQAQEAGLGDAVAAEQRAEGLMTAPQALFFSDNAGVGLLIAERQTRAALALAEAVQAPDAAGMWAHVRAARSPLEQLEVELMREEYPPFDGWYHETWIRSLFSFNNPHRSYDLLRAFISSQGRERPSAPPSRFVPGAPPAAPRP
jgi:hypothetical protein